MNDNSSKNIIEDAKEDFIKVYNETGKLSLFSAFIFYNSKGYNTQSLSFDLFCDYYIKSLNMSCINTNSGKEVPLVCVDTTLYILALFYNVNTKTNEFGKPILC